jgi:DNA polymerase/3'-5' exonuclease PolX
MFPYDFAIQAAQEFASELSSICDRLEIVGSLRRHRPYVGDIDLVTLPKRLEIPDATLLGNPVAVNVLEAVIDQLAQNNWLSICHKTPTSIGCHRPFDQETIPVDIYLATEQTWATMLLVRTGSRHHNVVLACRAMERKLHLRADGCGLFGPEGKRIPVQSEEEIFNKLGIPYRTPTERE